MTDKLLDIIGASFPLKEKDAGEFKKAKVSIMSFETRCFDAQGLGNVSVMKGKALMGLMKMDTVVINPFNRDYPMLSYDRIHAMKNDTMLIEIYETRINKDSSVDVYSKIADELSSIPDMPVKPNWYDSIRLFTSTLKKGKKNNSSAFDKTLSEYITAYIAEVKNAPACDCAEKMKAASVYTEGLLDNGGASTDLFVKAKGKEYTQKFFREVLFGTGNQK